MRKLFRAFFFSLLDAFRENLGYHSASLTYQFLTVMSSVFVLLGFASLYLPFLDPIKVYEHVKNLFPSQAEAVLEKLLSVYEKRTSGSLISLFLAYYFSLSFARTLNTSFGFVYGSQPLKGGMLFWLSIPLLLVVYSTILSFAVTVLTLSRTLLGVFYQRLAEALNLLFLLLSVGMLYSFYFQARKHVFLSAVFTALLLFLLNKTFSSLVAWLISTSPLYGVMGSPLLFLVWLYYSFFFLLLGVRFIKRLDESFQ